MDSKLYRDTFYYTIIQYMGKINIGSLTVGKTPKQAYSFDSDSFLVFPKNIPIDKESLSLFSKLKLIELETTDSFDLSIDTTKKIKKDTKNIVKVRSEGEVLYDLYNTPKAFEAYTDIIRKLAHILGSKEENDSIDYKQLFDFVQTEVVELCMNYRNFYLVIRNLRVYAENPYLSYGVRALLFYLSFTFCGNSEKKILTEMSKTVNYGILLLLTIRSLEQISLVLRTKEKTDVQAVCRALYRLCYMSIKKNDFPRSCIDITRQMILYLNEDKQKSTFLNHDAFTLHVSILYLLFQTDQLLPTPASPIGALKYIQEKFGEKKYLASMSRLNHILGEMPPGTWVQLKNKGIGMIVENNNTELTSANVILVIDSFKKIQKNFSVISTLSKDFAVDAIIQNRVILEKLEKILYSSIV